MAVSPPCLLETIHLSFVRYPGRPESRSKTNWFMHRGLAWPCQALEQEADRSGAGECGDGISHRERCDFWSWAPSGAFSILLLNDAAQNITGWSG